MNNFIEFLDPTDLETIAYRLKYGGGHKKQAIARAVGTSHARRLQVIDATCGFGTDALVLAYLNCKVFAIEKNLTVAKFLANRLEAAQQHKFLAPAIKNIQLFTGDCLEVIPTIIQKNNFSPDVIYLDPMFDHKTTAAPNKFIQILKKILNSEEQNYSNEIYNKNLLNFILQLPVQRIVVKRPRLAAPLNDIKPSFMITGKSNRFDVYLKIK